MGSNNSGKQVSFQKIVTDPHVSVTPVFQRKPSANLYACQDQVSCI
jgi:hypothetical protein